MNLDEDYHGRLFGSYLSYLFKNIELPNVWALLEPIPVHHSHRPSYGPNAKYPLQKKKWLDLY